jgi:hypothetical protein
MKTPFEFHADGSTTALVIVFPPTFKGLFNPEVHGLVRDVQERLDGVYVTYALSSGTSPDLRDAISAAQFGGCESAVIVPVHPSEASRFTGPGSTGDWLLTSSQVNSDLDAAALADAYRTAVSQAEMAA